MVNISGLILCLLLLTSVTNQESTWRKLESQECPSGFQRRGQVCYHISSTATVSRDDARSRCAALNSRLTEITSSEIDAVSRSLALAENKTRNYWIGLEQRNHTLRWMDGSPLNLTVWSIRQTQVDNVISDCVRTVPPWNHWEETNCNHTSQFLCEGKIGDFVCIGVNTTFNSSCYFTSNGTNGTRDQAKDFCDRRGAHLVFIETAEENSFLFNFTHGNVSYWIGMARHGNWSRNKRKFSWISGASLNYSNLVNVQNGSGCVQIQSNDNYTSWNEDRCDGTHGFICGHFEHSNSFLSANLRYTQQNRIPNPEYIISEISCRQLSECTGSCTYTPTCLSLAFGPYGKYFRCVIANTALPTLRHEPGYGFYTRTAPR